MFRFVLISGLVLLTAACVPIPPLETVAILEPETMEQSADCFYNEILHISPGESADDGPTAGVPDFLDFHRIETVLDGENLKVVFYLEGIPEGFTKSPPAKGAIFDSSDDYFWIVLIDVEGTTKDASDIQQFEYMLGSSISLKQFRTKSPPEYKSFEELLSISLYRFVHDKKEVREASLHETGEAKFELSHESNSLTLSGEVPGITTDSKLEIYTVNVLDLGEETGHDYVSC
ncbi:MAG: hypothetical protein OXC27_18365 [Caldilineaceae bacterium]|nr:hypothetical protein [Caldilineaceae bacterium]